MTPLQRLFVAIRNRDSNTVRSLLDEEPSLVHSRSETGESPLMTAIYHEAGTVLAMLIARGAELDIFAAAAAGHRERIVEILNQEPEQLDTYAPDGWTPLHLAAFFGQTSAAETLLERGAEVHARSRNPTANTPLHAALAGRTETALVRLLLAHRADANARGGAGVTPLHLAASRGNRELVEALLEHGATLSARMDDGTTPTDMAAARGHTAVAEWLRRRADAAASGAAV
jgi:uncharacterized protein